MKCKIEFLNFSCYNSSAGLFPDQLFQKLYSILTFIQKADSNMFYRFEHNEYKHMKTLLFEKKEDIILCGLQINGKIMK